MKPGAVTIHSRVRGQGGFTLIEAIVSLALVSTVVLTLAAGLLTTVRSSASAKGTQIVDGALSAYAESFKGTYPSSPTTACPLPVDFIGVSTEPSWFTADPPVTAQVVKTEGWYKPLPDAAGAWVDCAAQPNLDSGVTRLTVTVTADTPDGEQTATGQVVARRAEP